jgi:hypothetical protein
MQLPTSVYHTNERINNHQSMKEVSITQFAQIFLSVTDVCCANKMYVKEPNVYSHSSFKKWSHTV